MYYLCYALLYCIIFAFGAAIGSFLNVCIYRLPKEESLWRNNSHCMTCGTPIRKRDLIPIFSWCRLRENATAAAQRSRSAIRWWRV